MPDAMFAGPALFLFQYGGFVSKANSLLSQSAIKFKSMYW